MSNLKYRIIIPVYNDNKSVNILLNKIHDISKKSQFFFDILIIDDCSDKNIDITIQNFKKNLSINILKLNQNLGHQKAIFMGLIYTLDNPVDKIIIMDSDGEDNPNNITKLIEYNLKKNKNIVAKRIKRKESISFVIFYQIYKFIFSFLTGLNLNFGNFSIINYNVVQKILNIENNFNHYAASILKVDKKLFRLPIEKNVRFAGKSKMSFINLITHGLDAISIFRKEVIVRVILFSVIGELILLITAIIIFYLRFFTNLLITGQTTTVLFFLIVIGFVFISICLLLSVSYHSNINSINYKEMYNQYLDKIIKAL